MTALHRSVIAEPLPGERPSSPTIATAGSWLALLLAIMAFHPGTGAAMQGGESAVAEVMEVIEGFNDAFEANDPDRYFTFIDEDIVVLTPSSPYRVEGIADDREELEWGLRTGRSRIGYFQELQPLVRIHGDVAVVTYYSRGSYGTEDTVHYLKETDVLVRRPEGWKIIHIHVSATSR